jgi:hypothetical protein
MNNLRFFLALAAFLMLCGASLPQRQALTAEKPAAKVHIFYSSDALGYHEPCG